MGDTSFNQEMTLLRAEQVHKVERAAGDQPMSLNFSHRCGEWERPNLKLNQLPDDVEVDWVKVWK